MLSRAEVFELARSHGLIEYAEELTASVTAGWALVGRPGRPHRAGNSKIGGNPDLPAGTAWPRNPRGAPMAFLAQVASVDLPAAASPWRTRRASVPGGLFSIFADIIDHPIDTSHAAAITTSAGIPVSPTTRPAMPSWFPDDRPLSITIPLDERHMDLPEFSVDLTGCLSAPETHSELRPTLREPTDHSADYDEWRIDLRKIDGQDPRHLLLGEPWSLDDDVRELAAFNAPKLFGNTEGQDLGNVSSWRMLFSLGSDEDCGLTFGGAFTLLLPAADLASGRFDRLICVPEPG